MRLVRQGNNYVLLRADNTIVSVVYDSTRLQAARLLTKRHRQVVFSA